MKNIPKIIYLNQDYLGVVEEDDFDKAQWTWCIDKIDNRDIKYIIYSDYLDKVKKLNFFSEQPDIKALEKMATAQIKDLIMWSEGEIHDYRLYIEMLKDELRKRRNKKLCRKTAYK